ncbi:MAG: N-6 DNA methylase [Methylocystis sp.]|nr:N-6 DNA methylase [Methylocystis sp.]MCA3589240.1 N-6 DNA methylase [Methylocystis sp.]MCA3593528.1 N-6 DNA methylase [Methylocystis sp.]
MSQLLIQSYFNELDRLRKYSGSGIEGVISEAFKDLLKSWARQNGLIFIPQYPVETTMKTRIQPDGAILHDLRVPLGYWEAKDTDDDLDREIERKFRRGYPQDNIIFENSHTAVLIQNRREVMRCGMTDGEALGRLLSLFFSYEREEIAEFRKAVQQFKTDLPAVLTALREKIDAAHADNAAFREAAEAFLAQAKATINPAIGMADILEMLIQHILTEEIFAHVFNEGDFHRDNNIARALYGLEGKFFTGAVKKDTLKAMEPYYAAIRANAAQITSHAEKQTFLKVIYENFYKVYNPKAADRLGVVYTPNEIVKFMIEGADWLCQKHFGKNLIDRDVEILDPATGTGTFICELLEHFRGQPAKLAHKYKEELHANEVAILPYYVANLNIEATYAAISGQYAEFPNLCFVDTLDNVAGLRIKSGHQHDMFGAIAEENAARIKRQNNRKISVVIGNPPYNANQQNENDNNKNREYQRIDELIKRTYIRQSTAQKTKLYDMYARFFRWASDRLHDDGVLAFVTNRSFIDSRTFDGFRKVVATEFNEIHVVDLGGDVRANPKLSGTKNNVFGIQTGVAISFFVKRKGLTGCRIFYNRRPEMETAEDKLAWLGSNKASALRYEAITPDARQNWLNLTDNDWDKLLPVADKKTKAAKTKGQEKAIFSLYSLGINSGRDDWSIYRNKSQLKDRLVFLIDHYNGILKNLPESINKKTIDKFVGSKIKWTFELKSLLLKRQKIEFNMTNIVNMQYRPFRRVDYYFEKNLTKRFFRIAECQPTGAEKNAYIINPANGSTPRVPFSSFAVSDMPDLNFFTPDPAHAFPRYRYTPEGERIDNITDWALAQFRKAYGSEGEGRVSPSPLAGEGGMRSMTVEGSYDAGGTSLTPHPPAIRQAPSPARGEGKRELTKDAIFHYVYGVLHDPLYREKYAQNLKRDFPRLPFYPDFWRWADWGERLMALHIGYETVEPWPLERRDIPDTKARAAGVSPRVILRADRDAGIITLDSETMLSGIPKEVWDYRLGNRAALDWILDQHKEKTPKDPTIREKFNTYRFADYKEKVVDLLMRVTRVSVETVAITGAMRALKRGDPGSA